MNQSAPTLVEGIKSSPLAKFFRIIPFALISALLMYVAGHLGWLDWLERGTFQISAAISSIDIRQHGNVPGNTANSAPAVFLIDDEVFEHELRERSPIVRKELARLLGGIVDATPAALVIDFDLSPIADPSSDEQRDQAVLDALLQKAAGQFPVVLSVPFAGLTAERLRAATDWVRTMCLHPGIYFAYPELLNNSGIVARFNPTFASLGNVAFAVTRPSKEDAKAVIHNSGIQAACKDLTGATEIPSTLNRLFRGTLVEERLLAGKRARPINTDFFDGLSGHTFRLGRDSGDASTGRVTFVGGAWGDSDWYTAAPGRFPGVVMHASTYHSLLYPVREIPEWLMVAIETLATALLVYWFSPMWSQYFCRIDSITSQADVGPSRRLISYCIASKWVCLIVVIATSFALVMVFFSGYLLSQAVWFNFGPLVLAAFFEAKRTGEHSKLESNEEQIESLKKTIQKLEQTPAIGTTDRGTATSLPFLDTLCALILEWPRILAATLMLGVALWFGFHG